MPDLLDGKKLSVIVPVCERTDDTVSLYSEYKNCLSELVADLEFIYVISNDFPEVARQLRECSDSEPDLTLLILSRNYGEATAIQAGAERASGEMVLILPCYKQVVTSELKKLFSEIGEYDLALGKRWPRLDGKANQLQTRLFRYLLKKFSGQEYSDVGCGVRLIKTAALREIHMYGDQMRFMPLLAHQIGYRSVEVELAQATEDSHSRFYGPGLYIRRFLDLLTIVFLTKFNKKPLRFFGLIGTASIFVGTIGLVYLAYARLFMGMEVSTRPLLVMFSLFFVLGAQLIAIGLVGETIIFTHAKDIKEYRIKEIVN